MSLESGNTIAGLVATNPEGTDPKSQGDDHLRLIKATLKNQFAGFTDGIPITKTETQINAMLLAGAFGLGGPCLNLMENQINNPDIGCGFYYVNPEGLGIVPSNQYGYLLILDNQSPNYSYRMFVGANSGQLYGQVKVAGNWQAWGTQWDGINTPKQASMFDAGASCLLTPGSFGLGVSQPAGANANIANSPFAGVTYNGRWWGASWIGQPPAEANTTPAILTLEVYNQNYQVQTFQCLSNGNRYIRYMNAGVWSNFLLAPVIQGQSSASPGYQIINRICHQWGTHAAGLGNGGTQVIALPVAFTTPWVAFSNATASAASQFYETKVTSLTTTTLTLAYSTGTGSNSGPIMWHAIGLV